MCSVSSFRTRALCKRRVSSTENASSSVGGEDRPAAWDVTRERASDGRCAQRVSGAAPARACIGKPTRRLDWRAFRGGELAPTHRV